MKIKSISLPIVLLAFSFVLFTSCKDEKSKKKTESHSEMHESATYQCPMDCEDGKTYKEAGSCPVCKMDLKAVDQAEGMTCTAHKDGKCSCQGEHCKCANCKKHAKKKTCAMHEGDSCKSANCEKHANAKTCKKRKGGDCKSANCKEHAKKKACAMHDGGECTCEGEDCKCENCEKHKKHE